MTDRPTSTRRIRRLAELDLADAPQVGRKAAVLGHLRRAGHPVPDGFVVTAGAGDLSDLDIGQLRDAISEIGDRPLAVRSSSVMEDRPDRSYAGRYETVLGVRGTSEVVAALRRCLASADAAATTGPEPPMAVLVQSLINADAAGVAFTTNPVTGAAHEVVVNAVRGLSDRLCAGEISPEEWVVRGDSARRITGPPAIDAAQARAVAALARQVAGHLARPQDIEWAIADGAVWLLQARPITALPAAPVEPIPVPVEPPPGFWFRDATHFPQPRTPMLRSVHPFNEAMRRMSDEFGFLVTVAGAEIGGWAYATVLPAVGKPGAASPPAWLMRLLVPTWPPLRRRIRRCVDTTRSGHAARVVDQWWGDWRPALSARIETLREPDLSELDDIALDQHLVAVQRLLTDATHIHFLLFGAYALEVGQFALTCRDLLGWNDEHTLRLLAGLSTMSTEPARRITELARMAAEQPPIRELLTRQAGRVAVKNLAEADPEFAQALESYRRTFGIRAMQYELTEPSLAEMPGLLLQLIRDQLDRSRDPEEPSQDLARRRAEEVAAARAALAERPDDLARFNRLLARAERAYPVREDNEFYTVSVPLALMRFAALETGRRLTARSQLASGPDVFFLEFDEARAALQSGDDMRSVAARRIAEHAWAQTHPGPRSYGPEPAEPPSLEPFPDEVKGAMDALMWAVEAILAERHERTNAPAQTLVGIAASPGRHRGPVRIIASEAEFERLRRGDVLVCPMTSPVWSVLFPILGGLVTDSGGTLSHPAIIAREYRLPAVVATGNGTQILREGQWVTVDGTRGVVEIEP